MTTATERLARTWEAPPGIATWFTTVDHKTIGIRYIITAFAFFCAAGIGALLMRTQLIRPDNTFLAPETYDQIFSMHGTTMIFLFATPILFGFGNFLVPLMCGTRDMAFPRLNAFGYWVFLFAGLFLWSSFLIGAAPNAGWFNYVPLSGPLYDPGPNIDFYTLGLIFLSIATTAGAINFIVTIFKLRAPGMSINRMPVFLWSILATSFAVIFAVPALTAANFLLYLDRAFGFHFFDVANGGNVLLWQHLFWFFGHPDVYIIVLPALGIVSEIVPTFSRRPIVGYSYIVLATVATGLVAFGVWVHHMFAVGLAPVSMTFFSAASVVIAIPSGVQVFAWLATMLTGKMLVRTALLFVAGFLVTFVLGGLSGVMFPAVPFDRQITDSYFVVAHFHYVLVGGMVFPLFGAFYYWFPKMTGRLLSERLGKVHFWTFFVGFNTTFFVMHILGLLGMPRRIYTYEGGLGWDVYNLIATIGAYLLALGVLLFLANIFWSLRSGQLAGDNPWGGSTLEWATSSPPPAYNFETIPEVRSRDVLWDQPMLRAELHDAEWGGTTLAGSHSALSTSLLDAQPEDVVPMPEDSWWPLLAALAIAMVFVSLLLRSLIPAAVGAFLIYVSLIGWNWPKREEPAV